MLISKLIAEGTVTIFFHRFVVSNLELKSLDKFLIVHFYSVTGEASTGKTDRRYRF